MSVQEIKAQLATLPRKEQDEVIAYLFHLRQEEQTDRKLPLDKRSTDSDPAHWLSPDEFEKRLDGHTS